MNIRPSESNGMDKSITPQQPTRKSSNASAKFSETKDLMKEWAKKKMGEALEKVGDTLEREVSWSENENERPVNIKISALALKLGISKPALLDYVSKGRVGDLKKTSELKKLKELEHLSRTWNLPITTLMHHAKNKSLDSYLMGAINEIKWVGIENITLGALAQKFNISPNELIRYVKDERINELLDLEHIARTLDLPPDQLLAQSRSGTLGEYVQKAAIDKRNDLNIDAAKAGLIDTLANTDSSEFRKILFSSKFFKLPILQIVKFKQENLDGFNLDRYLANTAKVKWLEDSGEVSVKDLAAELQISEDIILNYARTNLGRLKELAEISRNLDLPLSQLVSFENEGKFDAYLVNTVLQKFEERNWLREADKLSLLDKAAHKLSLPKPIFIAVLESGKFKNLIDQEKMVTNKEELDKINEIINMSKTMNINVVTLLNESDRLDEYLLRTISHVDLPTMDHSYVRCGISELSQRMHISPLQILNFYKKGDLEELVKLEDLARTLELPLNDLVEASETGKMEEFLFDYSARKKAAQNPDWALETDLKCQVIFDNLDRLYEQTQGKIITQDSLGGFVEFMTRDELASIKKTVKNAYLVFGRTPPKTDQIISDSLNKHRILVQASGSSITIMGLFGKLLGKGSVGVAMHAIDLTTGTLATGEAAVLKKPKFSAGFDSDDDDIIREKNSLAKIHEQNKVLGIQNKVRVVKDIYGQGYATSHFGTLYETDLKGILEPKPTADGSGEKTVLTKEDAFAFSYQLFHGVAHMHKCDISHGDIKPENIFCDFISDANNSNGIGPRLYLGDFGGSVNHSAENSTELETTGTPVFRHKADADAAEAARMAGDKDLYRQIEQSADVFATCSTVCTFFTNELPYNRESMATPGEGVSDINPDLRQKLTEKGFSSATVELLISGLSSDYRLRPESATILSSIQKDLENPSNLSPERSARLIEQSLPL